MAENTSRSLALSVLLSITPAVQARADPQGLSASLPVRVRDAINDIKPGDVEYYLTERATFESSGRYALRGGPKLKFGLLPRLALNVLPVDQLGTAQTIHGGIAAVSLEYQLNEEHAGLPAFLVQGAYDSPYGNPLGSSEYHLIGVATHSLSGSKQSPRIDVEATWAYVTHPVIGERQERWSTGIAYSRLLTDQTALVVDVVHGTSRTEGKLSSFLDAGLNHDVGSHIQLGVGLGFGVVGGDLEYRIFAGAKWKP